jgi:hypothetical protein
MSTNTWVSLQHQQRVELSPTLIRPWYTWPPRSNATFSMLFDKQSSAIFLPTSCAASCKGKYNLEVSKSCQTFTSCSSQWQLEQPASNSTAELVQIQASHKALL